jgi:probable HAF family extracellular repeat protein
MRARNGRVCTALVTMIAGAVLAPAAGAGTGTGAQLVPNAERGGEILVTELAGPGVTFWPMEINERGQVVGTGVAQNPARVAVLLYDGGPLTEVSPIPSGDTYVFHASLNDRGDVAGALARGAFPPAAPNTPFLWTPGGYVDLGPAGTELLIRAVNDRRDLLVEGIGGSQQANGAWRDGEILEPELPEGYDSGQFGFLDDRGTAAGYISRGNGAQEAAIWQIGGEVTPLGTLGTLGSWAHGMTDNGIVGMLLVTGDGDGTMRSAVWHRGRAVDIGTLGGAGTYLSGLSERGDAVGVSDTSSGERHLFHWRAGRITDLGPCGCIPPPFTLDATALVNRRGQVALEVTAPDRTKNVYLWQHGRRVDLGAIAGGGDVHLVDMNDHGQIVGTRRDPATGDSRPIMWTVPPTLAPAG